jgi:hypothetical protein
MHNTIVDRGAFEVQATASAGTWARIDPLSILALLEED